MSLPICVIGTGASGVVATKELSEVGLEVDCFEIQAGPGGLYKRDNYEDACHTSSKIYTSFACFPPDDGLVQCGHYTLSEYCDYQQRFTEHFGIVDRIMHEHRVDAAAKLDDGTWQVTVTDLKQSKSFVKVYCAVVCCSGTHTHAPEAKSVSFVQGLAATRIHSHQFRRSKDFAGKRVIVVGGGESGSDVSCKVAQVAAKAWVATRGRTGHMTPRGPQMPETDHINQYHWHLADPVNQMPETSFDLDLSPAHFATATWQMGGDVDAIVLCIGYAPDIAFLDKDLKMLVANPRNSLKHCVHPDVDNFFLVGFIRPAFGNIPVMSELQSRWVAKLLTGAVAALRRRHGEDEGADREGPRQEEAQYRPSGVRVKALTNFFVGVNDIASYAGLQPDYVKMAFTDPCLALKILLGQTTCFTFRLKDDYRPEKVPAGVRLGLAAVLFTSKVYRGVVYPAAAVTFLLVLVLQLNSHRLEANFRQHVLRQPMKAYDCLKPSPWDASTATLTAGAPLGSSAALRITAHAALS
ncbi:N,N-dimethylaniline monooxygenase [Aureococcus anophagefferens]|nr:N,N-dimethylaniline monooxygenase [Aureococcus anophagefferens]